MKPIVIEMSLQAGKETKNCHRYGEDSGNPSVPTLYVRKSALRGEAPPQRIQLVLSPLNN